MKKPSLILMTLMAMSIAATANPVDQRTAQAVGAKFLTANTTMTLRGSSDLELAKTYSMNRGDAAFYVFNAPSGFVIVSADDCAYPILGYGDNGRQFDPNDIPIQLQDILQEYQDQIQYAVEHSLQPDEVTAQQWRQVKATGKLSNNRDNTQVGPLLTTTWDQGQYYNAMCPEDENGPDGHCVTGCVATAMAQILKYHGYPQHGHGSHSFNLSGLDPGSMGYNISDYGTLSVNFEAATYDYNQMPDVLNSESSQEEIDAVAQLMYHCGVAVNMEYSSLSSGAREEDVRSAFISYFGFTPSLGYAQKQMYTADEWADSLKANINRGEPVFYCGKSPMVAHAFVLDGYNQNDHFHFNFGWSGDCDGWFLISAINPSWSFNEWQSAIMGIRPDSNSHAIICHRKMHVQNIDHFTVTDPVDLYPMRGGSEYQAVNEETGVRIILNLLPEDAEGQLVLDVLDFDLEQSVVIYDGINKDSLVRVIETRNLDDYSTVTYHTWLYEGQPEDSVFQNMAGTDLSPIVSTRHGFTVVVYSCGGIPESFQLRVRNATDNPDTPVVNNSIHWTDIVTSEPDGYMLDGDTIRITSAEGLAWASHFIDSVWLAGNNWQFFQHFISIENDLDLADYWWEPIKAWYGNIDGHGHVISNMKVSTSARGGLFSAVYNAKISNIGMINSKVNAVNGAGSLAGYINGCTVENCYTKDYIINAGNTTECGGLIGAVYGGSINNCYAYGNIYSQFGYGGIVGNSQNSEMHNCVSQVGESYDWGFMIDPPEWRGLLTEEVHGGSFSNCFADNVKLVQTSWSDFNDMAKRAYFLGNVYNVDVIDNLAAFNIYNDPMGTLIADTAVNYTLGENMDIVTALNNKVAEYNMPNLRTWVRDNETHMPVFGDFYEVTCPNVSEIAAENIVYNNGFAVALSWHENGDAEEWQVKYNILNGPEESSIVITTNTTQNTIQGLQLGNEYVFYVRPICGDDTVGWGQPFNFFVDKTLWIDMVTSCPKGYYEDNDGNVIISSPEGLAWLAKIGFDYRQDTIFIVSDLDMGAYKWTPIGCFSFEGTVEGFNHIISNIYCNEGLTNENTQGTGLFGVANNASFNNIVIQNSSFSANRYVGSLVGNSANCGIMNCHTINVVAKGKWCVGGLGGFAYLDETYNCSSSGLVYSDLDEGGLFGTYSGTIANCYSSCTIYPLGFGIRMYYGGLFGTASGTVNNCYSSGIVEMAANDPYYSWGYYFGGTSIGHLSNLNVTHTYAQRSGLMPFAAIIEDGVSLTDTASFVNNNIEIPVTIAETSYTDLLAALNAWVDANSANGEYLHWVVDANNENGGFPMLERQPAAVAQISSMTTGWNWWSTYIEQEGVDGLSMLESSLGSDGVQIKSQTSSTDNYYAMMGENYWFGNLTGIDNESSYLVRVGSPCVSVMSGVAAESSSHPISVEPNWNWIGYPVSLVQDVNVALSGFVASGDDVLKSQDGSTTYYEGYGWFPDMAMEPGRGYLYRSNSVTGKTLTYSVPAGGGRETPHEPRQGRWAVDRHASAYNMTVIAVVSVDGVESSGEAMEMGAFVGGECRGSARLEYFVPTGRYYAVLTVTGEEGERVTFGMLDAGGVERYDGGPGVPFERDAVLGTLDSPYVVEFGKGSSEPILEVYPNPADRNGSVRLILSSDERVARVVVTDVLGRVVRQEAGDVSSMEGFPVPGIYNIEVVTDRGDIRHGRIIVK